MTKANVPPNVTPNVSDIHTYTLRTLLRVYRRTDDGKNFSFVRVCLIYVSAEHSIQVSFRHFET